MLKGRPEGGMVGGGVQSEKQNSRFARSEGDTMS